MSKNFVVNWYHTENDELTARFFSQVQKVTSEWRNITWKRNDAEETVR